MLAPSEHHPHDQIFTLGMHHWHHIQTQRSSCDAPASGRVCAPTIGSQVLAASVYQFLSVIVVVPTQPGEHHLVWVHLIMHDASLVKWGWGWGWGNLALQEGFEPPFTAPITGTEVEAQLGYCKLYHQ